MIYGKPLADVSAADIEALVDKVRENRHLDYKQELPGGRDSDKKKFLADVSALANSAGGDIIYGISEELDPKGSATGVPDTVVGLRMTNADQELRRLGSIIDTGLDPALVPKTDVKPLPTENGSIVVLRVPRSFAGPHMVRDTGRFHARHDSQNLPMDASSLRLAFTGSEAWGEKVERFRVLRLAKISAMNSP